MGATEQTAWATLLSNGTTPRWVPSAVARAIAEAHDADRPAYALPSNVRIDEAGERIVRAGQADQVDREVAPSPPEDLAATCGELLSLAILNPSSARHVFQQTALLWRAYREARQLPVESEFERSMVRAIAASLCARHPERWMKRLLRAVERGRIDTLHVWIDALYEARIK